MASKQRTKAVVGRAPRSARPARATDRASRPRDVEATKQRLITAVGAILARDGFTGLGINAIAHQAQTDKALIYRYFGGLPELLEAYAESQAFWPTLDELAGGSLERLSALPQAERWQVALHHYIEQLRKRPLTQEILAWELAERNEVTARLEEVRERRGLALLQALAHDLPGDTDLAAVAAVVSSAVHYLLLRARKIRVFNGIDLHSELGWARIEAAARAMIAGALSPARKP